MATSCHSVAILRAEDEASDAETCTWANNEEQKLVKAGLAPASIVSFDNFRLKFDSSRVYTFEFANDLGLFSYLPTL